MIASCRKKIVFALGTFLTLSLSGLVVGLEDLEPPRGDIRSLIQEGSYDLALKRLSRVDGPVDSFWHRLQKAYCLQALHRWDEAALLYEGLLETPSDLDEYLRLFLGICYARSGRDQEAEEQLTGLLETQGHLLADEAREELAHVYLRSNRTDEAIEAFQVLLKNPALKGREPEFLLIIGRAYRQVDRESEAAVLYRRIMSQYPASQAATEALEELKAIRGKPLVGEELFDAAEVLFRHRRYQQAAGEWSRFVELYPNHQRASEALFLTAQASYRDNQYSQAVTRCQRLLQMYPNSRHVTSAHYLMARCAEAAGEGTLALDRYHRFVRDFPWSQLADDALWRAAKFYEKRGDFAAAQREFLALSQQYTSRQRASEALRRAGLWAFFLDNQATAIDLFGRLEVDYPHSRWAMGALYWKARALLRDGEAELAGPILERLAQRDSAGYYGMQARRRLQEAPSFSVGRDSTDLAMSSLEGLGQQIQLEQAVAQHYQRGKALLRLGLLSRARLELSRVHRVAHRHPQVLVELMQLYLELQLHGDALRLAQQAERNSNQPLEGMELTPFLYPMGYSQTVAAEAAKYGLDPHFLLAVIRSESLFDPLAISPAGAVGLMQIMPSTKDEIEEQLGLSNRPVASSFNPDWNIRLGSYYLWRQLEAFERRPELALAAYNAGPGNVRRWLRWLPAAEPELFVELIEFPETREFIKKVLATQALYGRIWGAQG